MHVQVAIPSGPRAKPRLKRKDPDAVHLTEEEDFQLTFNRAKRTIGKLPDPQPDDAEATPPARVSRPDAEDEVEDPPPCSKVNSRRPPTTYTCKDKSKRTSEHSRRLDDDNADHHVPSMEDEEPPPLFCQAEHHAPIPLYRHAPSRQEKSKRPSEHSRRLNNDDGDDHPPSATSHIESNKDMATGTASHLADETLVDVEHVEQLVLLGDATSTNGHATASPHSCSSSLEWPGLDVDFTQIEEHEDPYEVEPETKAFDEDTSDDESDAYKPDNDNEDADKVGEEEEEEEEEEEVLLSPKVIQMKGKAQTAPSK
ncbi:hypothetical protein PAXINDRAFT_18941, partial [Paxillus involutus ATCC 200175]